MTNTKKITDLNNQALGILPMLVKWLAWIFIVVGTVLTVTLLGAFIGVPMILIGIAFIFIAKYLIKNMEAIKGVSNEQAEIIEHQLQQARAYKAKQSRD